MKKILALLVVFVFIFTFLVGCNETVDVESGDESVAARPLRGVTPRNNQRRAAAPKWVEDPARQH